VSSHSSIEEYILWNSPLVDSNNVACLLTMNRMKQFRVQRGHVCMLHDLVKHFASREGCQEDTQMFCSWSISNLK
jgi:hypothetical protein